MTFQFKFSKINETNIDINASDLEKTRIELANEGFELFEICTYEAGHSHEVWQNTNKYERVKVDIIPEKQNDEVVDHQDASRQDVVDELVDLWLELRAIRNHFTYNYSDVEDDDFYSIQKPPSPLDKFRKKVAETKTLIEEDQEEWNFVIREDVDAEVFAYYDLSPTDRLAIVH